MGEEQYPDGLNQAEWAEMKDDYQKELDSLKTSCLKKDGTPRKDAKAEDLERLEYVAGFFPAAPVAPEITDGDVYKHYVEREFYVVTVQGVDGVGYYTIKATSYFDATAKPYTELREKSQVMTLANMAGLVAAGKWVKMANVRDRW
jgi:hypothetical protein